MLKIKSDQTTVLMGHTLQVDALATDVNSQILSEKLLLPVVNGRRWGCHEWTDSQGSATFHIPLPNPGPCRIEVVAVDPSNSNIQPGQFITPEQVPDLCVGGVIQSGGSWSNPLMVEVKHRKVDKKLNGNVRICLQWEPWFGPQSYYWESAQALPVLGFYDSCDRDVLRQHFLWFADMGIDFLMADWSNHIWGKEHWNERDPGTNAIIHATEMALETLATMRAEGIPVPGMTFLMGISNGPPAKMTALNEQLNWVYDYMVKNPRFKDLWVDYDGKPLMTVLDCGVVAHPQGTTESAFRIPFIKQTLGGDSVVIDDYRKINAGNVVQNLFTIRWVSTQLQTTGHEQLGYWTWMDGAINPVVTYTNGTAEAVTVTPAFFAEHGWCGKEAYGRRGGTTLIRTFNTALRALPRVIFLHQWNEYAGQPDGHGYGPDRDIYVDSYSVELSDDLEPVSLTAPGYRKDQGGWGFYYANLTTALLDILRNPEDRQTILAVFCELKTDPQNIRCIHVDWAVAGKKPDGFTISIDGNPIRTCSSDMASCDLPLEKFTSGDHLIEISAVGTESRYSLSSTKMDTEFRSSQPASASCRIRLE